MFVKYNENIMRKIYFFISAIIIVVVVFFYYPKQKKQEESLPTIPIEKKEINKPTVKLSTLFVPYWTINTAEPVTSNQLNQYDRLVYFGVKANKNGITINDLGFKNLSNFIRVSTNKKKWLTVIMTDTDENIKILDDRKSWSKIIKETIELIEKY